MDHAPQRDDYLFCALAHRLDAPILNTDQDFTHYAKVLSIHIDHQKLGQDPPRIFSSKAGDRLSKLMHTY
ncbi:MAG: hypothetical protein AAF546_08410 [Verrucomicrobiota bacterium]